MDWIYNPQKASTPTAPLKSGAQVGSWSGGKGGRGEGGGGGAGEG